MTTILGGRPKTPAHLWLVGGAALLWNSFGAWDYLQTKLENRDYLEPMAKSAGVSVDTIIAYFADLPLWANIAWPLGVWGAVAGSLLLLARSRFAVIAFLVSLVSFVVSMVRGFSDPIPGTTDMTTGYIFTAVIFVILVALLLYARRMTQAGVLR